MRIDLPSSAAIDAVATSHGPESPTTSLIASLRSQLTLLSDQSAALNAKLIEAIDRHSNLEDTHLTLQQSHNELNERANRLAAEKAQWEESMNTGLLVERSQIKDEMQRLAAGLVEEERRRGSAEVRRQKVEEEVDELAASLFDQVRDLSRCLLRPSTRR
jgi:predicted nuclease with TOPRIM domain